MINLFYLIKKKGGVKMKNNIVKGIVIGLVVLATVAAVMSSFMIWHQPETPECIV